MPINILMPALSPTMTEGTLARWLKNAGDHIAPGDVIAEIETDKATMEVEAVDEGKMADIRVAAGTANIPVNTVIAVMIGEDETEGDIAKPAIVPPVAGLAPEVKASVKPAPVTPQRDPVKGRILASPLAKRIAGQLGIDLTTLRGTGPNGRIVKADLEAGVVTSQAVAIPAAAPAMALAQPVADHRRTADLLGMKYAAQPNTGVRKTIARRLTEAKQQIPHFYLTVDAEIDMVNDLRRVLNARDPGGKISVNDFVIKAAAMALKQVPAANASWTDSDILLYEHADISVAVATDNGLITPIIKAAETKTLPDISREMKELGTRARAGKLKPEEFQGGSFSVSNLGMYGIREFSAIINPPQACILAVGAGEQRPVVKNGALAIATMMTCTLSVDHRAVDGAVGAEYLAAFKKLIEDPLGLVL